jgi:hypothetical protein
MVILTKNNEKDLFINPMTITTFPADYTFRFGDIVNDEYMIVKVRKAHGGTSVTMIPRKRFKYKLFYRVWRLWIKLKAKLNII